MKSNLLLVAILGTTVVEKDEVTELVFFRLGFGDDSGVKGRNCIGALNFFFILSNDSGTKRQWNFTRSRIGEMLQRHSLLAVCMSDSIFRVV